METIPQTVMLQADVLPETRRKIKAIAGFRGTNLGEVIDDLAKSIEISVFGRDPGDEQEEK